MIVNIICDYKEFRKDDRNKWRPTDSSSYTCNLNSIMMAVESTQYFGGSTHIKWKNNRRYGLVPVKYEVTSACGKIKRIYEFNYNRSYNYETE